MDVLTSRVLRVHRNIFVKFMMIFRNMDYEFHRRVVVHNGVNGNRKLRELLMGLQVVAPSFLVTFFAFVTAGTL